MAEFADHRLPSHGLDADAVLSRLDELAVDDRDWRGGRVFSLVYSAGDDVLDLLARAANRFSAENALNTCLLYTSDACAADGRYSFLLDATPLPLTAALGSPVNPVALR